MIQKFASRLYGPGQPNAGAPVQAEFVGNRLRVGPDPVLEADVAQLGVTPGGFNQDDVVLGWEDGAGIWGLMVSDAAAKTALLAQAPEALKQPLRRWNRSVSTTRNLWRTIFSTAAVIGLAIGLGLWQYDRVIAWTAERVSPENERRLGLSVLKGIRSGGHLVEESPALEVIRDIGGQLTRGTTRKYEWYLLDEPSVNAFALPGGFVVVHAGLVHSAESADELAGVLAHEIQHIEQRHTLQALLYQLGWAAVLAVVLGDPSAMTAILLLEAGNLNFSRELEAKADAGGVESMRRAGIPPQGMADFFRKLAKDGGSPPAWISTHPETADRIAAVEEAIRVAPCTTCKPLVFDWAAVRESLYKDRLIRRPAKKKQAAAGATQVPPR